jgi:hypothetical protein
VVLYFNGVQLEWFCGSKTGWVILDVEEAGAGG